ncbi:MAG: hypothetical protein IKE85_06020 [Mogibacterium sp.]|nr:hypothetical protein [Mogibacterium sp.]
MIVNEINPDTIPTWKAEFLRKEHTNVVLEKIKDDIGRYELDCRFVDYSQIDECTTCNKNVFESIYRIIDKYIEGSDSE